MNNPSEATGNSPSHGIEITVIVNGKKKVVDKNHLTFDQIVALADDLPTGDNVTYTITFRDADQKKSSGVLPPGEQVKVKDGTKFDVTATDKS